MRIFNFGNKSVNTVTEHTQGNNDILSRRQISASRHTLNNGAAAVGANTDELMAVMDSRLRRRAQQQRAHSAPTFVEDEGELVV